MRTESSGTSYLAFPDGPGPCPGVVVVHEAPGLNDNTRDLCRGGSIILTWACTDDRLAATAPFYGAAPRARGAIRRLCPVVGSWPGQDVATKAAGVLAFSAEHVMGTRPGVGA